MKASALAAVTALVISGCQSDKATAPDFAEYLTDETPVTVVARLSDNIAACWFGGARPAFADYSYAPELTSYSNRPRVLIVPKADPGGLPKLVVEASTAENGARVKLFGPLLAGPEAAAIRRDVGRWVDGARDC